MTTENTSYAVLSAPEMDGMFTATAVTEPELLDQCRALVYAITELTNPTARDCLTWLLMERLAGGKAGGGITLGERSFRLNCLRLYSARDSPLTVRKDLCRGLKIT